MAELGDGEQASGAIAAAFGLDYSQAAGTRQALIRRGLTYSPRLGHAAFTVPLFGDYLRRTYELEQHAPVPRRARHRTEDSG